MVARAVFRGPEKRLGDRVRIHIQLIYAPRDQHLWAATYERNLKEVQELQADAARDIAGEIYARRYSVAIAQLKKTLEMDPDFGLAHYWLWYAYTETGMYSDAFAELEKTQSEPVPVFHLSGLAYLEAKAGKKNEAHRLLAQVLRHPGAQNIDPTVVAYIYVALGEMDQGFGWLEKAYTSPQSDLSSLKIGPMWDPIRSDPRFGALVRRVGLQP